MCVIASPLIFYFTAEEEAEEEKTSVRQIEKMMTLISIIVTHNHQHDHYERLKLWFLFKISSIYNFQTLLGIFLFAVVNFFGICDHHMALLKNILLMTHNHHNTHMLIKFLAVLLYYILLLINKATTQSLFLN